MIRRYLHRLLHNHAPDYRPFRLIDHTPPILLCRRCLIAAANADTTHWPRKGF